MKLLNPSETFVDHLTDLPLFSGLDRSHRWALLKTAKIVSAESGDFLFREGDPALGFFILKTGRVKLRKISASGHEVVLHIAEPPHMIGCKGLTLPGSICPADAVAIDATISLHFQRELFLKEVANSPEVFFSLLVNLNQRLSEVFALRSTLQEPVAQRIATFLLLQAQPMNSTGDQLNIKGLRDVRLTKRLIAAAVGTTTETAIRVLSKWSKQGMIASQRGRIKILDPEAILALTQDAFSLDREVEERQSLVV